MSEPKKYKFTIDANVCMDNIYGIIYQATNIENGKKYIGQTTVTLNKRIGNHLKQAELRCSQNKGSYFNNAILKYGLSNFLWEIIDSAKSKENLNEKEKEWIWLNNTTFKENGYNLAYGGDGCTRIDIRDIMTLIDEGWNISETSEILNVGKDTVLYRVKSYLSNEDYQKLLKRIDKGRRETFLKKHGRHDITIEKIKPLLDKKLTFEEIGELLGCSKTVISTRLKEYYGDYYSTFTKDYRTSKLIKTKDSRPDITVEKILKLRKNGLSFNKIGDYFNCSKWIIITKLKKNLSFEDCESVSNNKFKSKKV